MDRGDGARLGFLLLVAGGLGAERAEKEFGRLAKASGRLYQTLPPPLAPIHATTSPRNLWATVLFGWLRGSAWVRQGDNFEAIDLPFAASAELWRRLLYGTTPEGTVQPGNGSQQQPQTAPPNPASATPA